MIPEQPDALHDTIPSILILGGTNFMGKALLSRLSSLPYRLCCINRGKSYWNDQARNNPRVEWFCADRRDHKDYSATVKFASKHLGISQSNKWAAVVDFCGFKWRDLQSSLSALQNITQKYIFISSDSVYNNSIYASKVLIQEDNFDLEQQYDKLRNGKGKDLDDYGYNKMKCEIYLRRKNSIPFVCLRLPDVIGPYDNTNRFWITLNWMQWSDKYPLGVCAKDQTSQLSMVSSQDVANCIVKLIPMAKIPSNAYNLAFEETSSLVDFLQIMRKYANLKDLNLKAVKGKSSNQLYPSVECGAICCLKAKKQIGWSPSSLTVCQTVDFFKQVAPNYISEQSSMQREFRRKVIDKN